MLRRTAWLLLITGAAASAACARSGTKAAPPDVEPAAQPGAAPRSKPPAAAGARPDAEPAAEPPAGPAAEPNAEPDAQPSISASRISQPNVRVGIVVGSDAVRLGGSAELILHRLDGTLAARVPSGAEWQVLPAKGGLTLLSGVEAAPVPTGQLRVTADSGALVRVNGREYRGEVVLLRDRTGITVLNRLPIEVYLTAVVASELGRRAPAEIEALRAQAVVSRTYALRNLGRWGADGFDLYATVADQAYAGVAAETELASTAVRDTRGQVLTYAGGLIDAFFSSTCGGQTAEATEIFRYASRRYLKSVRDESPSGEAYCSISPRYHWHEEWDGDALAGTLRQTLPGASGIPAARVRTVRDVRVAARTGSGRVALLAIALADSKAEIEGPMIRRVLRTASGDPLRSNAFSLNATTNGGRITRLIANGSGAGHAVGLCQWGAIGRARAGQDYRTILAAYFVGTSLDQWY